MPAPHPFRTPESGVAPTCPEADGALRVAQSVTKVFLLGWSLVRVAVCSVRGIDLEGCAALVVVVAMTSWLVDNWSPFS